MQMLPVVVDDDSDEGPPEEHAEQEDLDDSALVNAESSNAHDLADSPLPHTDIVLCGEAVNQASAEDLAASIDIEALTGKERQQAEKQLQKAEKARQKAEKERQKAEKEHQKADEAAAKACCLCGEKADAKWLTCSCSARSHVECLAKRFLKVQLAMQYAIHNYGQPNVQGMWTNALSTAEYSISIWCIDCMAAYLLLM